MTKRKVLGCGLLAAAAVVVMGAASAYKCTDFWDQRSHPDEVTDRNRQVEREIGAIFFLEREGGTPEESLASRLIAY